LEVYPCLTLSFLRSVRRRHCDGHWPPSVRRTSGSWQLRHGADHDSAHGQVLPLSCCGDGRWPPGHCFDEQEVKALAAQWAIERRRTGRASGTKWPEENLLSISTPFLRFIGRLRSLPVPRPTATTRSWSGFSRCARMTLAFASTAGVLSGKSADSWIT